MQTHGNKSAFAYAFFRFPYEFLRPPLLTRILYGQCTRPPLERARGVGISLCYYAEHAASFTLHNLRCNRLRWNIRIFLAEFPTAANNWTAEWFFLPATFFRYTAIAADL